MKGIVEYRIRDARDARGWTQAELAERAGTTQQAIQRYESGEREPRMRIIAKLSAALGVTISYLLGLDDEASIEVALAPDERELIKLYRATDARGRDTIMAVARSQSGDVAGVETRSA